MWTISLDEEEHRRARLALQRCPNCGGEYGSASFPIHVARCREVYAKKEGDDDVGQGHAASATKKTKVVPKLSDLCIKYILANMHITCLNGLFTQPAHQAWLIASLPGAVLQQIMMHMVHRVQKMTLAHNKHKTKLQQAKERCTVLEIQTDQMRALRRECERLNQLLTSRTDHCDKAKREVNSLKHQLHGTAAEATKLAKQVEQLRAVNDASDIKVGLISSSMASVMFRQIKDLRSKCMRKDTSRPPVFRMSTPRPQPRRPVPPPPPIPSRPRSTGSKIPLPSTLPATYVRGFTAESAK
ncbi:Aste57867_21833 [Aphanomyces stellatus]|uniref:Aste57867_21833 protein n=1 Tax=Aphanomyces stellatus TaxID=120398 RepID=A0A485LIJ7_9STRA|nr:hypothetical protein As57867_021764 [Aphanomyces stellatus]VFT98502.1 Aste57867_21833 [Aphanomyces stellatus]